MRSVKKIHKAEYSPIADLVTYRALPTRSIDHIDPFLFLNHHGFQTYKPGNRGLPFGPHPHRGFETVTFILKGDIMHKDTGGYESTIEAGGVQWMTAGKGLIHSEVSSENFKVEGGDLEILQLWLNLPAKYKMIEPRYIGLQKESIPTLDTDNGKVTIHMVSGDWRGKQGAFQPLTDVHLAWIDLREGGKVQLEMAAEHNIFFYIVKGEAEVNGTNAAIHQLVEFNNDGKLVEINCISNATILIGHAVPFNEPVVAQGPFVMNTEEEIRQAYQDYQQGKFGTWNE